MKKMVEREVCDKKGCKRDKQIICAKCGGDFCKKHNGRILDFKFGDCFPPVQYTICGKCYKAFTDWLCTRSKKTEYEWYCYLCGKVEKDNVPMGGPIICDECSEKEERENVQS